MRFAHKAGCLFLDAFSPCSINQDTKPLSDSKENRKVDEDAVSI